MIHSTKTDLLTFDTDAIGHCANCFCTMGSGIAKQIKEKLPEAFEADLKTEAGDRKKFGSFSCGAITSPKIKTPVKFVYNLYGQYYYGKDSRKLNYESIYTALLGMRNDCVSRPVSRIGFPKNMGCMLAGGSWKIVESMIYDIYENGPFDVYICEYTV